MLYLNRPRGDKNHNNNNPAALGDEKTRPRLPWKSQGQAAEGRSGRCLFGSGQELARQAKRGGRRATKDREGEGPAEAAGTVAGHGRDRCDRGQAGSSPRAEGSLFRDQGRLSPCCWDGYGYAVDCPGPDGPNGGYGRRGGRNRSEGWPQRRHGHAPAHWSGRRGWRRQAGNGCPPLWEKERQKWPQRKLRPRIHRLPPLLGT